MLDIIIVVSSALLSVLQIGSLLGLCYYYLWLTISIFKPRPVQFSKRPAKLFAVAIPAHNEEAVLGDTLRSLWKQNYPPDLFDIYVVADHCDDRTALVARKNGAFCYERNEGPRGRKAYALRWLIERILNAEKRYDAVIVLDADSKAEQNFLRAMEAKLSEGYQVLQGQHVITNPQGSGLSLIHI